MKPVKLVGGPKDGQLVTPEKMPLVVERPLFVRGEVGPRIQRGEYRPTLNGPRDRWVFDGWDEPNRPQRT